MSFYAPGVLSDHLDRKGCSIALRAALQAVLTAGRPLPRAEASVSLSVAAGRAERIVVVVSVVPLACVDIDGIGRNIDLGVPAPVERFLKRCRYPSPLICLGSACVRSPARSQRLSRWIDLVPGSSFFVEIK